MHLFSRKAAKLVVALALMFLALWMSGVQEIASRLVRFPEFSLICILLLMFANLWLVAFRFWRIVLQFSYRVPFSVVSRATFAGYFAGLYVISILGQVIGRQAILREAGIPPAVNSVMAGYERSLLLVVSGIMALLGATYLFGLHLVGEFFNRIPLFEISAIIALSLTVSLKLGGVGLEMRILKGVLTARNLLRVLLICALAAAGQLLILTSFVVAILAIQPAVHLLSAIAAASLISFIASMPISVNGWGVREIASVFVLGRLGIPPEEAVAASILIGVSSTLVIISGALLICRKNPIPRMSVNGAPTVSAGAIQNIEKIAAWMLGMAVVLTIFFQIHVPLNAGFLNINLADPFAILSLTAVISNCLMQRAVPHWRLPDFNRILAILSAMLVIGFAIGVAKFGVTQWALSGRFMGWLVLLGYLCAGYLLLASVGNRGLRHLMRTLSVIAVTIVLWQAINRVLAIWGYEVGYLPQNFDAYSGNRNAFAFQLLAVTALLLAYARLFSRASSRWQRSEWCGFQTVVLAMLSVGIVWTASRAGMLTGALLLIVALTLRVLQPIQLIRLISFASLIWVVFWLAGGVEHGEVQGVLSAESSNDERWATWVYAIRLWLGSPIWGAGLGAFMFNSTEWLGHSQVIHSTPLWLLAEFGVIGLVVVIWSAYKLLAYAGGKIFRPASTHHLALLFLLFIFAIFSLAHEIFYQRIVWLMLGALLAYPGASEEAGATHE